MALLVRPHVGKPCGPASYSKLSGMKQRSLLTSPRLTAASLLTLLRCQRVSWNKLKCCAAREQKRIVFYTDTLPANTGDELNTSSGGAYRIAASLVVVHFSANLDIGICH